MDPRKISDAEFAVMDVIWSYDGPVWFSQIRKALNQSGWAEQTLRSMVGRLEKKGVLLRSDDGDLLTFTPTVSREEYKAAQIQDLLGRVYGGDIKQLKAALTDYEVDESKLEDLRTKWRKGRNDE